nr:hypothetical protein [Tanacetum cinerariifolium]
MHGYTTWWEHGETEDTFHHMGQCSNAMDDDKVDAATHMELNNPTDYNLGLSSEEEEVQEEEVPNKFTQRFYGFKDNDVSLYAGCQNWTKLQAATRVLSWKSDLNIHVEALNALNLVLTYMPIADRLQMIYMSEKTTKYMTWHADHKTADGRMVRPSDGRAWKNFDLEDPLFAHEIRNVRLGLCTDGFSPTSSCSKPYTCWPVFVSVYNLPPWMALKESYVQHALLILGRKSLDQNIDVLEHTWKVSLPTLHEEHRFLSVTTRNVERQYCCNSCKLEKVFLLGLFDSMEHLIIHLVNEAINGGIEKYMWMYLYERKLGSLKITIRNRARAEGSIVKAHRDLAYGPINEVTSHTGYIVNGYKFHTLAHGSGRVTNNTEVCVKGSCYNEEESDYYGELKEVIEAVVKAMPRGIFQVAEGILATKISNDDNVDGEEFFQENDRLVCTIGTTEDIQQVTLVREEIKEVQTALVTDDTNDNGEKEEFEDMNGDDDSSNAFPSCPILEVDLEVLILKSSTSRSIPTGRGGSSIVGRGREIANEWSPRGRGNNISSGNDRDIPDECSPIGRGSNNTSGNGRGRADDCGPRGRGKNNTSGNDRGIPDDISPRVRGSTNRDISYDCIPIGRASSIIGGCGNKSADEWCPALNILGDEILDVHEDNEEHVEYVVGSLQNQVGSNVTPSSSLPKLFYDPAISRHAVRLFKTMFKGAYATWTKVPQDHRDRYSDIMRGVRKAAMKVTRVNDNVDIGRISSSRLIWISQSGKHTSGSRSFLHTKIVMGNQKGRKVKLVELHTAVHTKKGTKPREPGSNEISEFVDRISKQRLDEYAKIISKKNKESEENTKIDENGSKSPPDDFEVLKGVGTSNKGHVLGAGFTTDPAFVLTGTMGSGSIYATHTCSPYEEIWILKKRNDDLKKKMEDAEAQRVADQLALHKTRNDFAQKYPPRATKSDPGAS